MKKLPALTGLRFVAAAGVLLFHGLLPSLSGARGSAINAIAAGFVGVSLFFVLSGFILAYTYLSPDGSMRGSSAAFLRARFARVYPVYALSLVIAFPLFVRHSVMQQPAGTSVLQSITAPLLLQSWFPRAACAWNCPGWSLSDEALFYLAFPTLALLLARIRPRAWFWAATLCWAAAVAVPLAYVLVKPDGLAVVTRLDDVFWLDALKYTPLMHLPEFLLGMTTGLLFVRRTDRDSPNARGAWLAFAGLLTTAVLLTQSDKIPYPLLHNGLLAPVFAATIYGLACGKGILARILGSRPFVVLGEASYALYLVHAPIRGYWGAAQHASPALQRIPTAVWFPCYVVGAVGAALLIFRFVEEPARRYLRERPFMARGGAAAHAEQAAV